MNDKKNEKYYNLSNALEDFADAYGAKDKAISGLKLLGKGLFNVAKYAATDGCVFRFVRPPVPVSSGQAFRCDPASMI